MLYDPAYRDRYEVDLQREFPRVYFRDDFCRWTQQRRELLDLHIGFETADPWPWDRQTNDGETPTKAILRADRERGVITLDQQTTLSGAPAEAWEYRLGIRSSPEWVLDQYKEKRVKDPTIRERFNTNRFADHKERVVDLLGRVCAVSVFTTNIVNELGSRSTIEPAWAGRAPTLCYNARVMPVYEYRCNRCGAQQSRLVFSWTPADALACNDCDGADLTRLVSGFSFHRSWGDSLNWMPDNAAADLDDTHIGSIDGHMGRMGQAMGGQVTTEFHEHRHEITHPDP